MLIVSFLYRSLLWPLFAHFLECILRLYFALSWINMRYLSRFVVLIRIIYDFVDLQEAFRLFVSTLIHCVPFWHRCLTHACCWLSILLYLWLLPIKSKKSIVLSSLRDIILGTCYRFFLILDFLHIYSLALFLDFLWTHNKGIFPLLRLEGLSLNWIDDFTFASHCTYVLLIFKMLGSVSCQRSLANFRGCHAEFELHFFVVTKLRSTLKFIPAIFTQRLSTNRRLLSRTTSKININF